MAANFVYEVDDEAFVHAPNEESARKFFGVPDDTPVREVEPGVYAVPGDAIPD